MQPENKRSCHGAAFPFYFGERRNAQERDAIGRPIFRSAQADNNEEETSEERENSVTKERLHPVREQATMVVENEDPRASTPVVRMEPLTRCGMTTMVVGVYHIEAGFARSGDRVKQVLSRFIMCLKHEADVVYGDANSAAYNFHTTQSVFDPKNSIVQTCFRTAQAVINRKTDPSRRLWLKQVDSTSFGNFVQRRQDVP